MATETVTPTDADRAILVVEDHDDLRAFMGDYLKHAGYRVVGCPSAVDALTVLQGGTPVSLILLDLMMPGVTGFQFRTEQRADESLRDIPVIVLTGARHSRDYHANLHAVAYLEKPVNMGVVLDLVHEYCGPPAGQMPAKDPPVM